MNKKIFIDNIKAANKEIPCDLVVKNIWFGYIWTG